MPIAARGERGRSRASGPRRKVRRRPIDAGRAGAGLLAGACLAALLWVSGSESIVLTSGQVVGARHTEPGAALRVSGLEGARAFRASAADARARLRSLPAVRDARVDLNVLGTFRIALVEREAAGRWVAGGTEWFVDREGVLFSSRDALAAPALRIRDESEARRQAGDRIDPALLAAAFRLAALAPGELRADMRAPSVRVEAGPNGIVLTSGARWELRFGSADRFEEKLAVAREFLRNEPDRPLDYVDVRSPDRIVFSPR